MKVKKFISLISIMAVLSITVSAGDMHTGRAATSKAVVWPSFTQLLEQVLINTLAYSPL